jgi:hypothetical protein
LRREGAGGCAGRVGGVCVGVGVRCVGVRCMRVAVWVRVPGLSLSLSLSLRWGLVAWLSSKGGACGNNGLMKDPRRKITGIEAPRHTMELSTHWRALLPLALDLDLTLALVRLTLNLTYGACGLPYGDAVMMVVMMAMGGG